MGKMDLRMTAALLKWIITCREFCSQPVKYEKTMNTRDDCYYSQPFGL